MLIIYLLLGIIAVGVLLASEAGRKVLSILVALAAIAGILWLGFWVVVIIIGLITSGTLKSFLNGPIWDTVANIFLTLMGASLAFVIIYSVIDNVRQKRKKDPAYFRKLLTKYFGKDAWKHHKAMTLTIIVLILLFLRIAWVAITNP